MSTIWQDVQKAEEDIERRLATRTLVPTPTTVGALKAEPTLAVHSLEFEDYLESQAEPATKTIYRGEYPGFTDSLGNEDWGDCGDAMVDHGAEADDAEQGLKVVPFVEDDSLELYSDVSGFNKNAGPPGQNKTDVGTDNSKLQKYLIQSGAPKKADGSRTKWVATANVRLGSEIAEHIAIIDLVNLYRAVGLPTSAEGQNSWFGTNGAVGSWGYHDIPYQGIRAPNGGFLACSWGMLVPVGADWDKKYAVQGFVAFREWVLGKTGVSPSGLNWTRLVADIKKVAGIS